MACESDDPVIRKFQCDRTIAASFVALLDAAGSPGYHDSVCLPPLNNMMAAMSIYEAAVIGWLRAHPESGSSPTLPGLLKAVSALYSSKNGKCPAAQASSPEEITRIGRSWSEDVDVHCAGPNITPEDLVPQQVGSIDFTEAAVSRTGLIAVVDFDRQRVLLFRDIEQKPIASTPLGGAFRTTSLKFSTDGHFLSWSDGFQLHIFDVVSDTPVKLPYLDSFEEQWIGDDLLVRAHAPNFGDRLILMLKHVGNGFMAFNLSVKSSHPNRPYNEEFQTLAVSDQFGQSFLRGDKVYASPSEALADGAEPITPSGGNPSLRVYRLGEHLLRVEDDDNFPPGSTHPWSLVLRNGSSGEVERTAPITQPWCKPLYLTARNDSGSFAMLLGEASVSIINSKDLSKVAYYRLHSSDGSAYRQIEFLPDDRLVAVGISQATGKFVIAIYSAKK